MAQNKEETINNKIELSTSIENNNQISEENNSLNIINKGSNDYIKLRNSIVVNINNKKNCYCFYNINIFNSFH